MQLCDGLCHLKHVGEGRQWKTEEKWPRRTEKYEGVVARKSSEENVSKRE